MTARVSALCACGHRRREHVGGMGHCRHRMYVGGPPVRCPCTVFDLIESPYLRSA